MQKAVFVQSQFFERVHMKFMAACDLGPRWRELAEGPTLLAIPAKAKVDA